MTNDSNREPPGGWIQQGEHFLPVRVYYEDTDFSGLVYHASYLRFMERGRSEFLRQCAVGHRELLQLDEPVFWTVRSISIRYSRPARVEDALLVRTRVTALTGARMHLDQSIERGAENLTNAAVEVCIISATGRPQRIPGLIRKRLELYNVDRNQRGDDSGNA